MKHARAPTKGPGRKVAVIIYIAFPEDQRNTEVVRDIACRVISHGHLPICPGLVAPDTRTPGILDEIDNICMDHSDEMWIYGEEINDQVQQKIKKFTGIRGASRIFFRS